MKSDKLLIRLLGGFSAKCSSISLDETQNRSQKVWLLIEYLLVNRNNEVSPQDLYQILWSEYEQCDNPANALKNLVYRARKVLSPLSDALKTELIVFQKNGYSWNNEIPIAIDIEKFEHLTEIGLNSENNDTDRMNFLWEAIKLYRGEFLAKTVSGWAVNKAKAYAEQYILSVISLSRLFVQYNQHERGIEICLDSLRHYPFEERIHRQLLISYLEKGQNAKALKHYTELNNAYYAEYGVEVSEQIKSLYHNIISSQNQIEMDISVIAQALHESYDEVGAFLCEYEVFRNIYRVQARSLVRTGQAIQLALVTLTTKSMEIPQENELKVTMNLLKRAILSSLRKGDTVASYSTVQFVILLPLTAYENCESIVKRIKDTFRRLYRKNDMDINVTIRSVSPSEEFLSE